MADESSQGGRQGNCLGVLHGHRVPKRRVNYGKNFKHRDTKKLFK